MITRRSARPFQPQCLISTLVTPANVRKSYSRAQNRKGKDAKAASIVSSLHFRPSSYSNLDRISVQAHKSRKNHRNDTAQQSKKPRTTKHIVDTLRFCHFPCVTQTTSPLNFPQNKPLSVSSATRLAVLSRSTGAQCHYVGIRVILRIHTGSPCFHAIQGVISQICWNRCSAVVQRYRMKTRSYSF